jgi:hypothetical protein
VIERSRELGPEGEEFGNERVRDGLIMLLKVTFLVRGYDRLDWETCREVIGNLVVRKVIEDLHGDKIAGLRDNLVPLEDRLVHDVDDAVVSGNCGGLELLLSKDRGNLDDPVPAGGELSATERH